LTRSDFDDSKKDKKPKSELSRCNSLPPWTLLILRNKIRKIFKQICLTINDFDLVTIIISTVFYYNLMFTVQEGQVMRNTATRAGTTPCVNIP
jgi:hypothetical protein